MKIPTEDFTVVTLAIGDTYGNDVRGDKVADMVLKIPDVITDVTGEEFLEDRDSRSCRHDS